MDDGNDGSERKNFCELIAQSFIGIGTNEQTHIRGEEMTQT